MLHSKIQRISYTLAFVGFAIIAYGQIAFSDDNAPSGVSNKTNLRTKTSDNPGEGTGVSPGTNTGSAGQNTGESGQNTGFVKDRDNRVEADQYRSRTSRKGYNRKSGVHSSKYDDVDHGPSATISFEKGKATLTSQARTQLRDLVTYAKTKTRDAQREADKDRKIDMIQIAVWADRPAPKTGSDLSKADRELAENREKAIREYMKEDLKVSDLNFYNMAEDSNWLSRALNTTDAEIKEEVQANRPLTKEEFRVFKENGRSSKAVVLVKYAE